MQTIRGSLASSLSRVRTQVYTASIQPHSQVLLHSDGLGTGTWGLALPWVMPDLGSSNALNGCFSLESGITFRQISDSSRLLLLSQDKGQYYLLGDRASSCTLVR